MARLGNRYPVHWVHSKHEEVLISGRQKLKLPPLEILRWLFRYDSESGKLFKIRGSSGKLYNPEKEITAVANAYLTVGITDSNGLMKVFKVHQIIYFMVSGIEPLQIVDHIDGNPLNNKFDNLRLTTESGNNRNAKMKSNNTSGVTGVYWHKRGKRWRAQTSDNTGKVKYLGYFDNIETAAFVVQAYRNEMGNYSDRHGASV